MALDDDDPFGQPEEAAPEPETFATPVTFYSYSRRVGGADEMSDTWTDRGYSSKGKNLTEGVVAVNPRRFPLGSVLRDDASGNVFLATDAHGNPNPSVVDFFVEPDEYDIVKPLSGQRRSLSLIGQVDEIPKTREGVREVLSQYGKVPGRLGSGPPNADPFGEEEEEEEGFRRVSSGPREAKPQRTQAYVRGQEEDDYIPLDIDQPKANVPEGEAAVSIPGEDDPFAKTAPGEVPEDDPFGKEGEAAPMAGEEGEPDIGPLEQQVEQEVKEGARIFMGGEGGTPMPPSGRPRPEAGPLRDEEEAYDYTTGRRPAAEPYRYGAGQRPLEEEAPAPAGAQRPFPQADVMAAAPSAISGAPLTYEDDPFGKEEEDPFAKDLSFMEQLKLRWRAGREQAFDDQLAFRATMGELKWEDVKDKLEPSEGDVAKYAKDLPWYGRGALTFTQMVPAMIDSITEGAGLGLKTSIGMGAMAAAAGQAGPQVLTPEELVTVPGAMAGGYAVGQTYGTWDYWRRQGAGDLYHTLRKEGIPHNVAQTAALYAAIPYASVELIELAAIVPGAKHLARGGSKYVAKKIAESLKKRMAKLGGRTALRGGTELGGEVAQEYINATAEALAETKAGVAPPPGKKPLGERLQETAISTAEALPFMVGPVTLTEAYGETKPEREAAKKRRAEMKAAVAEAQREKVDEIHIEPEELTDEELEELWGRPPGEPEPEPVFTDEEGEEIRYSKRGAEEPAPESEHRLGVKRVEERVKIAVAVTKAERELLFEKIEAFFKTKDVPQAKRDERRNRYRREVVEDFITTKARFPVSEGWKAGLAAKDVKMVKPAKGEGEPRMAVKWQAMAYTFSEYEPGKPARAGSKQASARAEELSDKLVEETNEIVARARDQRSEVRGQRAIAEKILRQRYWYRNMVSLIRYWYGGFGDAFADLLGAFSPKTDVNLNWKYAIIAIKNLTLGVYDPVLSELDAWLKAGKTMKQWRDEKKTMITQPNGKLFGMNSDKGMKAMLDLWRMVKKGDAPKARNFSRNLIGLSLKATIDVWAARGLQRMAHDLALEQGKPAGNYARIPTVAEKAVQGNHTDENTVGGAFGLAQDAYERAAAKLRAQHPDLFGDMSAADLQALLWFREKEFWNENKWSYKEGGSFEANADVQQMGRFLAGEGAQEAADDAARVGAPAGTSEGLAAKLARLPWVFASRVKASLTNRGPGTDIELLAGPGVDPDKLIAEVAAWGAASGKERVYLSRVLDPRERNPNARPGLDIYFKTKAPQGAIDAITELLRAAGIQAESTLIVDPRTPPDAGQFLGVRYQYIPELAGKQYNAAAIEKMREKMEAMVAGIAEQEGVAHAGAIEYDTLVLHKNAYDSAGTIREKRAANDAQVWAKRARDIGHERTAASAEFERAHGIPAVHARGTQPGTGAEGEVTFEEEEAEEEEAEEEEISESLAPGRRTVPIRVFDRAQNDFVSTPLEPNTGLARQLKLEEALYSRLIDCLT